MHGLNNPCIWQENQVFLLRINLLVNQGAQGLARDLLLCNDQGFLEVLL